MIARLWSAFFAGTNSILALVLMATGRALPAVLCFFVAFACMAVAFLNYGGDE